MGCRRLRFLLHELAVEEVSPEPGPGRPLVTALDYLHGVRIERLRHHAVTVGKAILAAISKMHLDRIAGPKLDEAPDAAFIILRSQLAGLPAGHSGCALDLARDHVVTEVRRQQAQSIDLGGVAFRVGESDESAERYSADPDGFTAQGARRQHELVAHAAQNASVSQVLKIDVGEYQIERQASLAHGCYETCLHKVVRPGIGSRQK